MNATTDTWQDGENPEITLKVHGAQIQQLYKQTTVALIGLGVVAFLICFALWHVLPHWKLLSWGGASLLLIISRGVLSAVYHRKKPSGQDIYRWAKLHVISASASALLWAVASLFLWPENSPVHQLIWPICIVAVSAAALAMYCTWTPSYLSYLLLSVTPISLRFLFGGETTYVALGILGLLFIVILAQTGMIMHTATRQALVTGIRNEVLNQNLAEEKAKQDELNRELQAAHDQLNRLSMTDELTGLWNRRYLNATIPEAAARAIRLYRNINNGLEKRNLNNIDIGFVLVDLDHFKTVNDTYGHSAGDKVLIQIRKLLTERARGTDTVVRLGGDEFLVVARNCRRSDYSVLVENIRQAVKNHLFDIGMEKPVRLTCSIGVAVFPFLPHEPEAIIWDKVLEFADACLYAAKRSGRDTWVGIMPTGSATLEDLEPNLTEHLPRLIQEGKLTMQTSLPDSWPFDNERIESFKGSVDSKDWGGAI